MTPKEKARKLLSFLEKNFKAGFRGRDSDSFRVLISCVLSQRTRDQSTARAAGALFARAGTVKEIIGLQYDELERLIRPSGFYRQKALRIKQICRRLLDDFGGKVPKTRAELLSLSGIGYKCADIVLMYGHGTPAIPVDVHVGRVPKRIGIVDESADVEEVKRVLESLIPKEKWYIVNHGLVRFGQSICKPLNPKCKICSLKDICDYYGHRRRLQTQKGGDKAQAS